MKVKEVKKDAKNEDEQLAISEAVETLVGLKDVDRVALEKWLSETRR